MFSEKYRKIEQRSIFVSLLLLFLMQGFAQTSVFVSSSATDDTGDGTTWETAKKTIAAGITAAGTDGTVCVKAGSYVVSAQLNIPIGVRVQGGYRQSSTGTDTTQRRLPGVNSHWTDNAWCTIISGKEYGIASYRIATVHGLLEGCVIRAGSVQDYGGGVLIDGEGATVRYCVVKECEAINDYENNAEGGGVYIRNNGTLINSVVTECRADNGVGVAGEDGYLINNTITRNYPSHCGYVVDVDGNYYNTVLIGTQCWMKENLRTTHYPDSAAIIHLTGGSSSTYGAYYKNANLSDAYAQYGLLYNWLAVMHGASSSDAVPSGRQGICPNGWHVPSNAEWTLMENFLKSQRRYWCNNNSNYIGKSLAAKTGWNGANDCSVGSTPSTNNATRFSALPAGRYIDNSYSNLGLEALFWTATQNNDNTAYMRYLNSGNASLLSNSYNKSNAYSVRCVKNN